MSKPALPEDVVNLRGGRPTRAANTESDIKPGRPKFPPGLSRAARTKFKTLCADLESRKVLTPGDREAIALYSHTFDRWLIAKADCEARGFQITFDYVLKDNVTIVKREKENPFYKILVSCERSMFAILQSLGLTPVARGKVKPLKVPKVEQLDEFEELMRRRPRAAVVPFVTAGTDDAN